MILAVDSSALALLINPAANPPKDPETEAPVAYARERVEHLINSMTAQDTIIIPTPVLAEALVRAEDGAPGIIEALAGLARIKVRPFGERAAIETAFMTREAIQAGDKRGGSEAPWQKVKVDRQVIAIARVESATKIYADDHRLVAFARRLGMEVFSTWELPVPEQAANLFTASGVPMDTRGQVESDAAQVDRAAGSVSVDELLNDPASVDTILHELESNEAAANVPPDQRGSGAAQK